MNWEINPTVYSIREFSKKLRGNFLKTVLAEKKLFIIGDRMTLETWVKNTWLEECGSDREEIGRLLALADGCLEDYRRATAGKLSADVQLGLAYDAIRISATAALGAAGYRVVRGGGEHYRTIEALEFSIDPQNKLIPTLDKLRKSGTPDRTMISG